jgi:hypothetical protein
MFYEDFLKAIDDYSPWVTDREPTREDGDELGRVFYRQNYYLKNELSYHCGNWEDVKEWGFHWMRIPK